MDQYISAMSDFDKAIQLNPSNSNFYSHRAVTKVVLGQSLSAVADFEKAIQLDPSNAHAFYSWGVAKYTLNQYTSAIKDFNKAIRLDPDYAEAYHFRGSAKQKLSQYVSAIGDFDEAIHLNPGYAESYNHRGTVNLALKRPKSAMRDFDKAIELNPDYTEAYVGQRLAKLAFIERNSITTESNITKSNVFNQLQTPQQIAKKSLGSTVLLITEDAEGEPYGLGSGFFIGTGRIATNLHVVEDEQKGYAKLVGRDTKYNIDGIIAIDEKHDLVILQATALGISPLPLGNSDTIEIAETVYVAGNPKGLEGTFSNGIISSIRGDDAFKLIQMTAPISPGSSGGPVLNANGKVIGISVLTVRDGQNLNFAIPINYIKSLLAEMQLTKSLQKIRVPKNNPSRPSERMNGLTSSNELTWLDASSYTFSLKNTLQSRVVNVSCVVIFYDADGNQVGSDVLELMEPIDAMGTVTVVRRSIFDIPYQTNLNIRDYSIIGPIVKRLAKSYEIRIIDFRVLNK